LQFNINNNNNLPKSQGLRGFAPIGIADFAIVANPDFVAVPTTTAELEYRHVGILGLGKGISLDRDDPLSLNSLTKWMSCGDTDELVKSHIQDGTVKSSICKAYES